jgi:hypothetical protein
MGKYLSQCPQHDAHILEFFVLPQAMSFTNIQLDDFSPTLAHFLEHIEIERAEECTQVVG